MMRSLFSTKKPPGNFKWGSINKHTLALPFIAFWSTRVWWKQTRAEISYVSTYIYMFFEIPPKIINSQPKQFPLQAFWNRVTFSRSATPLWMLRVVSSVKWSLYKTVTTKFCSLYVSQLPYHHPVFVSHLSLFWI